MAPKPTPVPVAESTEVAVTTIAEPMKALSVMEEMGSEFLADAEAAGMDFAADDVAIPFVRVLQSNSPEVKRQHAKYVDGAAEGMLFNTVTKEISNRLIMIPVAFRRSYVEFKLRESAGGGGFVKDWGVDGTILERTTKDDKNRDITETGTQIVYSHLYYVLVLNPDTPDAAPTQALFALSSTQLKKARQWNAMISQYKVTLPGGKMFTPPMWFRAYDITTVGESNDKGSWSGYRIAPFTNVIELPNGKAIYAMGKEFHGLVTAGAVKVNMEAMGADDEGGERPVAGAAALDGKSDDEIPF